MRNLTLRQLQVFTAVAKQMNFTAAARELKLSQPAVTTQIQQLEEVVGALLFDRTGRHVRLTEAGTKMIECSERINDALQDAREYIEALRGWRTGTLKLTAVGSAAYFAPALLAQFAAQHPGIAVHYATASGVDESLGRLRSRETDLLLVGRSQREADIVSEAFAPHPFVLVASPDHPMVGRRTLQMRDLAGERIFTRERQTGTRSAIEKVIDRQIERLCTLQETRSQELIKHNAMTGAGLGFLSMHAAGRELAAGQLAILNVQGLPVLSDWTIVRLRSKHPSPTVTAFRDFVMTEGSTTLAQVTGVSRAAALRGRM